MHKIWPLAVQDSSERLGPNSVALAVETANIGDPSLHGKPPDIDTPMRVVIRPIGRRSNDSLDAPQSLLTRESFDVDLGSSGWVRIKGERNVNYLHLEIGS